MAASMISVRGLSKKFCRSLKRSLWYGLRDLGEEVFGGLSKREHLRKGEFWALRDISFDVGRGECVGLIGRNGAGKTTLLRMLSGLMKPDLGEIRIRGRLQALIALGAGFNPVLTGRENVYVSGAVLGIPKAEIAKRFDEIVDFSGVREFIDAPVQSYSSGMAVRLGFSVAVYMDPDILLVDEVLAVGDIPFRARCHRKLGEMKDRGIPWILVSHNMGTIRNQTDRVIYLQNGAIKRMGPPTEAVDEYLYDVAQEDAGVSRSGDTSGDGSQSLRIRDVTILDRHLNPKDTFETGEQIFVRITYVASRKVESPTFGISLFGSDGIQYVNANSRESELRIAHVQGEGTVYCQFDALPFTSGVFRVRVDIWDKHMGMCDKRNDATHLHVKGGRFSMAIFHSPYRWQLEAPETAVGRATHAQF